MQCEISVTSGANVLVHVIPIEVFELLCREVHSRYLVSVMIGCVEAIAIVEIDGGVRMSWAVARDFDF
jgi:hypothetical protein